MRRVLLLLSLAGLAVLAIPAIAGARTETRFSVVAVQKSQHNSGSGFIVRERLFALNGVAVGHDHLKITPRGHNAVRIRAVAFFRGQGSLKVKGIVGRGRNSRLPIIGGTGDFNGAAGKLKTHSLSGRKTLLNFIFVQ